MQKSVSRIDELSIIIPTLNEEDYLPWLLDSIARQDYSGKLEVLVVDGHSEDQTLAVARSYGAKIPDLSVVTADRNVGLQRNVGASRAKYKYLLFLDADVVLPPGMLTGLLPRIDPSRPFIAGVFHTSEQMNVLDRLFLGSAYLLIFFSWVSKVPAVVGDFVLTTRAVHDAINGFVEGALLGEDTDYGVRAVRAGAKFRFFFHPQVIASDRRVRQMGRLRLLMLWSRGFMHVISHGPIMPGTGYEYPFGHHGTRKHD